MQECVCGEKGTLLHCWWECKLVQLLWRTVWRFLKKLKIELPYDTAIPTLETYLEKTIIWKDTHTPMFIAALFTTAKTQKQPECPSIRGMDKMWYMYTVEHNSTIKKNQMQFVATWMDLEIIIESKSERQMPYMNHMWNLIFLNDINKLIYKVGTDSQILKISLWQQKGKGWVGGINQELGINIHMTI